MIQSAYSPQAAEVEVPELSATPLDVVALLAQAHHPRAGAVVLFSGEVRNHNNGMQVDYLEYEAHEAMAAKMIKQIIADAHEKYPLNIALAQHRTGKVTVGETAVVVITASAHRSEAYAANQYIIDRIKHEATIWKCEYFSDGSKQWGGNCSCH
jgi:molybdopterin synthase catalytic subunit